MLKKCIGWALDCQAKKCITWWINVFTWLNPKQDIHSWPNKNSSFLLLDLRIKCHKHNGFHGFHWGYFSVFYMESMLGICLLKMPGKRWWIPWVQSLKKSTVNKKIQVLVEDASLTKKKKQYLNLRIFNFEKGAIYGKHEFIYYTRWRFHIIWIYLINAIKTWHLFRRISQPPCRSSQVWPVGWCFFPTHLKNMQPSNWKSSPNFRGEHKEIFETTT